MYASIAMSKTAQEVGSTQRHKEGSFRYAEKRRTGTCRFADRVASTALEEYRRVVPQCHRDKQKHECVAAILAHFPSSVAVEEDDDDDATAQESGVLQVIGLGVGTKFLPESILRKEIEESEQEGASKATRYGERVRDCHAEVLARRAFRWQITREIHDDLMQKNQTSENKSEKQQPDSRYIPVLQRLSDQNGGSRSNCSYGLKPCVTLHFYSSSAPCGNATLKKFAKMQKEKFDASLGPDEWPRNKTHEMINGHAIREGQFSLLLKKDNSTSVCEVMPIDDGPTKPKGKRWPANESDDWCPPGCTIADTKRGSIHTCSDKLARWNCLGLQGSLLSSMVDSPLHMSTLTVGRKMTNVICRRAVCCRAWGYGDAAEQKAKEKKRAKIEDDSREENSSKQSFPTEKNKYRLNHPVIMGTSVYIDEDGVLDMSGERTIGQDFRFESNLCWAMAGSWDAAECIDGMTGYTCAFDPACEDNTIETSKQRISQLSTAALAEQFNAIARLSGHKVELDVPAITLTSLQSVKLAVSPEYETAKENFTSKHRVFRQWVRRTTVHK